MNLVMQLRKVCNHPELLKPKETQSPIHLTSAMDFNRESLPVTITGMNTTIPIISKEIFVSNCNPIKLIIPKTVYDECFGLWQSKFKGERESGWYGTSQNLKDMFFNIYNSERVYTNTYGQSDNAEFNCVQMKAFSKNAFSAHLLFGLSFSNIEYLSVADPILRVVCLLHLMTKGYHINKYHTMNVEEETFYLKYGSMLSTDVSTNIVNHQVSILDQYAQYNVTDLKPHMIKELTHNEEENGDAKMDDATEGEKNVYLLEKNNLEVLRPLILPNIFTLKREITNFNRRLEFYQENVSCWPVDFYCNGNSFMNYSNQLTYNVYAKQVLTVGLNLKPSKGTSQGKLLKDHSTLLPYCSPEKGNRFTVFPEGGTNELMHNGSNGYSKIQVPDFRRLINDCGKMEMLDTLMKKLHAEKHRCLIFCQMTKMMDIIEEYLSWMQYTYFRMDGSTQINDRRDMVDEFQNSDKVFCFLLSTRAGGLGITLTGADTVIFYDSDWNPTIDAQATDRAHRIGQTKEVSVYRLITKHTIEENIVKRAKQKENVQSTVYAGGALRADTLKPSEFVGFLVDEENEEENEHGSFIKTKKRGKKAEKGPEEENKKEGDGAEKKDSQPEQHKIQYHYMSKQDRNFTIDDEDEAKAKEALKLLKNQKIDEEPEDEDEEEDDISEQFKDLLDKDIGQEVKFNDDEEDNIQVEEEE